MQKQLVGILLFVYEKKDFAENISGVRSDLIPVGIMGVMGNKGGVAIRFDVWDSSFCVINSHLNAGQGNTPRRNQDYLDISTNLAFEGEGGTPMGIFEHDFLFWMGDLNYRINGDNE